MRYCPTTQVSVYDTTKNKVLYEIPLQHAIVLLDVWSNYVVVSSRTLQLFEIQEEEDTHKLRRIVVMDEEDTTPFTVLNTVIVIYKLH